MRAIVTNQGAPRISDRDNISIIKQCDEMVILAIDCSSKRHNVDAMNGDDVPTLYVSCNEETLHWDESYPRESFTVVELPDFPGWEVWSCYAARYSIYVTLYIPNVQMDWRVNQRYFRFE